MEEEENIPLEGHGVLVYKDEVIKGDYKCSKAENDRGQIKWGIRYFFDHFFEDRTKMRGYTDDRHLIAGLSMVLGQKEQII